MKKLINDFLYILLALVFGVVRFALPGFVHNFVRALSEDV